MEPSQHSASARSSGKAIAIGVIWALLGIVLSVFGAGVVLIGLNGFMRIGPVTKALWFVISPAITIGGGVPPAIAFYRGAATPIVLLCAVASIAASVVSWISIFVAAPA